MFYPQEICDITKILDDRGKPVEEVSKNRMRTIYRAQYIIQSIYTSSMCVTMCTTLVRTVIYGEKEFMTPFVITRIDPYTNNGYIITSGTITCLCAFFVALWVRICG